MHSVSSPNLLQDVFSSISPVQTSLDSAYFGQIAISLRVYSIYAECRLVCKIGNFFLFVNSFYTLSNVSAKVFEKLAFCNARDGFKIDLLPKFNLFLLSIC
jgi:hypothetical protein